MRLILLSLLLSGCAPAYFFADSPIQIRPDNSGSLVSTRGITEARGVQFGPGFVRLVGAPIGKCSPVILITPAPANRT